jgi:hypothetical protein
MYLPSWTSVPDANVAFQSIPLSPLDSQSSWLWVALTPCKDGMADHPIMDRNQLLPRSAITLGMFLWLSALP